VCLLWSAGAGSRGEALAREAAIKRLSRAGKLRLVAAGGTAQPRS
jgi:predicted GIY-YIG superfamily endonuclease